MNKVPPGHSPTLRQVMALSPGSTWHSWAVLWYVILGFIHELTHLFSAWLIFGQTSVNNLSWSSSRFWYHLLVGRRLLLSLTEQESDGGNVSVNDTYCEQMVRHAGWVGSLLLAVMVELWLCEKSVPKANDCASTIVSAIRWASWITAVEALWTDLFQFPVLPVLLGDVVDNDIEIQGSLERALIFSCGNFGIILLHHAWWTYDNGRSALDILEKMVQVTMMRGAQSGGVVCFHPCRHKEKDNLYAVRSRVVNKKRTDLSVLIRHKIARDNFNLGLPGRLLPIPSAARPAAFPKDYVPVFSGHTRFATSSKATFGGTHPHRWTPPSLCRVYNFQDKTNPEPQILSVENYITHNGDFDFYRMNGKAYDVERIQEWLERVLHHPMPSPVDSCAVAGMVDLLRTQGCFGLSARYAVCLGLPTRSIEDDNEFPPYSHFEEIGKVFEQVLAEMIKGGTSIADIDTSTSIRNSFALRVASKMQSRRAEFFTPMLDKYVPQGDDGETGNSLVAFCAETIRAFFDHDLLETTKTFLANAVGSFGLCTTSSLDASRQICLAARGQTMSIAFYPRNGIILYGSEQAAVKAGIGVPFPGNAGTDLDKSRGDIDDDALRIDLDDLGGEVVLLDYRKSNSVVGDHSVVSMPNRNLLHHSVMNGAVTAVLYEESKATTHDRQLYHRMLRLTRNKFVKALPDDQKDLILKDITEIPKICAMIQDDWHVDQAASSMNRLTAHTLSSCLRQLLEARVAGKRDTRAVDILLTGCEVSLWLAEQFASDLHKAFPDLNTLAISSNKLLGLYGQDTAVPAFGFPYSSQPHRLHDTIVIIVSHSGGTFAPLSCSNLMQSATRNIFVVTSEWDTQVGKQLRAMDAIESSGETDQLFLSRIFSTEVGIRPAEPCSLSVVATHQLLTQLFEYIAVVILSDMRFRTITAAVVSEQDLQILERCNRENVAEALPEIVGVDTLGCAMENSKLVVNELREAGDHWANHILENARAYIMTFVYIFVTLISGYPLGHAIAYAAGLGKSSGWNYLIATIDAAIYFWLPQINITILRLFQGRNLLHRMTGRTVCIADIPWVAQCAEAFLSKIFAVSYSIAGLNVLSGNPVDHFVHRHTHRVVRGSLVICGRPDGRLSALSTAEAAACLSVSQASSIQSWGGTCESITIGHNPFKLPLSARGIFLKRKRPVFLCERLLLESDVASDREAELGPVADEGWSIRRSFQSWFLGMRRDPMDNSLSQHHDSSVRPRTHRKRSAAALMGKFKNFEEGSAAKRGGVDEANKNNLSVDTVIDAAIQERKWSDRARKLFGALDKDGDGFLGEEEFIEGSNSLQAGDLSDEELRAFFRLTDRDSTGFLDYNEFLSLLNNSRLTAGMKIPPSHRDGRGLIQIEPSHEKYFGELMRKYNAGKKGETLDFAVARSQEVAMQLYETRIASMQRFVAMVVMFHRMGQKVEGFFENISFGLWGYRMDRTHSIMRIATTASPVSGADVRDRMRRLQLLKRVKHSIYVIEMAYLRYKETQKNTQVVAAQEAQKNTQVVAAPVVDNVLE